MLVTPSASSHAVRSVGLNPWFKTSVKEEIFQILKAGKVHLGRGTRLFLPSHDSDPVLLPGMSLNALRAAASSVHVSPRYQIISYLERMPEAA